jgi:WD40 repeat protein
MILVAGTNCMLCSYDDKGRKLADWKCSYDDKGPNLKNYKNAIRALSLSADSRTLVTGGDDKCVRVWDVYSAKEKTLPLRGHADGIQSVCMAPGGDLLASASDDMTVRLWDLRKTGKERFAGKMEHADKVTAVVWIHTEEKGEQIVSASGKLVIVWDPSRLQEMARLIGHTAMVTSLAVHPQQPTFLRPNLVFAGSKDRTIRVFDITTASRLSSAEFEAIYPTTDGKSEIEYDSRMAYVLEVSNKSDSKGVPIHDQSVKNDLGNKPIHSAGIMTLAMSHGNMLASGSCDASVRYSSLWPHTLVA